MEEIPHYSQSINNTIALVQDAKRDLGQTVEGLVFLKKVLDKDHYHSDVFDPQSYYLELDQKNFFAYHLWRGVVMRKERIGEEYDANIKMADQLRKEYALTTSVQERNWFFVTISYNHKVITNEKMRSVAQKIKSLKGIQYLRYNHEKFRRNDLGEIVVYYHTHFLIRIDRTKSNLLQDLKKTPVIKSVILNSSNIDIKNHKSSSRTFSDYLKYINLDKTESKKECIELDKIWRQQENMESLGEII